MDVARLKNKFQNLLTRQTTIADTQTHIGPSSKSQASSITDSTTTYGLHEYYDKLELEDGFVNHLNDIAVKMDSAGCLYDCVEVYKNVRKQFVNESFKQMGFKKLSPGDIRGFLSDELGMKIQLWIRAAEVCVRILFAREKELSKLVFEVMGIATYEKCFIDIVNDAAIELFNFAKAFTTNCLSPKNSLNILRLCNTLLNLMPDIKVLFRIESGKVIRTEATLTQSHLEDLVRGILPEFGKAVVNDMSTTLDDGEAIHPLNMYVMNFIKQILYYKNILTGFILSSPLTNFRDLTIPDVEFVARRTPLGLHLILIIAALRFNLEGKSKYYEDASLVHLFMTNNIHFIVQQIKRSPQLQEMIGEDYMNKLTEHMGQAVISYQSSICDKLLYILRRRRLDGIGCVYFAVSKTSLRKRIETFNTMFNEFHKNQATWEMPDLQLKTELRVSVAEKLIPAYMSFLEQFNNQIEADIIFSVQDLQNVIMNGFFLND